MQNTLDHRNEKSHHALARRRRAVGVLMLIVASILWSVSGVAVKKIGQYRVSAQGSQCKGRHEVF